MTAEQFYPQYSEYLKQAKYHTIREKAIRGRMVFDDIRTIYNISDLSEYEYAKDMTILKKNYLSSHAKHFISFSQYAIDYYQKQIRLKKN
jgi:hypothetical protein